MEWNCISDSDILILYIPHMEEISDLRGSLILWHAWNRNAGRILIRELEGKRPFGRPIIGRVL
jgi:hypothetical protein